LTYILRIPNDDPDDANPIIKQNTAKIGVNKRVNAPIEVIQVIVTNENNVRFVYVDDTWSMNDDADADADALL
jgi:hypothetical protein